MARTQSALATSQDIHSVDKCSNLPSLMLLLGDPDAKETAGDQVLDVDLLDEVAGPWGEAVAIRTTPNGTTNAPAYPTPTRHHRCRLRKMVESGVKHLLVDLPCGQAGRRRAV